MGRLWASELRGLAVDVVRRAGCGDPTALARALDLADPVIERADDERDVGRHDEVADSG